MPDVEPRFKPDCSRCCGLCCVAPAFLKSSEFAFTKPAGKPCRHLTLDFRCDIHTRLRPEGFGGCVVYDCFGAGQRVTQQIFGGETWRSSPAQAEVMFDTFRTVEQLHGMLVYLAMALRMPGATPLGEELALVFDEVDALSGGSPQELAGVDLGALRSRVEDLLRRASRLERGDTGPDAGEVVKGNAG